MVEIVDDSCTYIEKVWFTNSYQLPKSPLKWFFLVYVYLLMIFALKFINMILFVPRGLCVAWF